MMTEDNMTSRNQPVLAQSGHTEAEPAAAITAEAATVFRAGNRRFFTQRAAYRSAAKQYLKAMFRASGDDPREVPADRWNGWVEKLAAQVKGGQPMAFAEEWFEDPLGGPRTPTYGVSQ